MNKSTELIQDQSITPISFEAKQTGIPFQRPKWAVRLTPELMEFSNPSGQERFVVPRDQGKACIRLTSALIQGYNVVVKQNGKTYNFRLAKNDLSELRSWLPPRTTADLKDELRTHGIGMILVGVAHVVLAGFLDPIWGGVLIAVGVLNLLLTRRVLFIANGIALIAAGVLNLSTMRSGWGMLGLAQIIWGLYELAKFNEYASAQ